MLALLGALPIIGQIVNGITTAFFNAKVSLVQARIGGDRDVAIKLVQAAAQQEHENAARLGVFSSNKFLTVLLVAFAIPVLGFEWKVVLVDNIVCPWRYGTTCTTAAIGGQVGDWMQTIIYFLFGAPTVMGLGKMWFGRDKSGE